MSKIRITRTRPVAYVSSEARHQRPKSAHSPPPGSRQIHRNCPDPSGGVLCWLAKSIPVLPGAFHDFLRQIPRLIGIKREHPTEPEERITLGPEEVREVHQGVQRLSASER